MGDPRDFYMNNTGYGIKQEPMVVEQGGGMPIPSRKNNDVIQGFKYDLDPSNYDVLNQDSNSMPSDPSLYTSAMWSSKDGTDTLTIKMEDDNVDELFQVDKSDLIQDPTLAELNANENTFLEDLNFDDILLPEDCYGTAVPHITRLSPESMAVMSPPSSLNCASSFPSAGFCLKDLSSTSMPSSPMNLLGDLGKSPYQATLSPTSQHSSSSSIRTSPLPKHSSPLQELLLKRDASSSLSPDPPLLLLDQSVPGASSTSPIHVTAIHTPPHHGKVICKPGASRLSSSAPSHSGFEHIWQRREPRPHLLSTSSLIEAGSTSSLSTGGILSPEAHDFSLDEGFDSEDDSEHYEDFSSDQDSGSDNEGSSQAGSSAKSAKKERFFWQYNVQSKGPKGQRLVLSTKQEDPHCLNEITDPVFSPGCSLQGIKHSGKARKGDGNDLTPNPRKLNSIGIELDKLSRVITDMTPVSELPFTARPSTRKEKNKLASRACRLKKKAQHEANKIKLVGVEYEHKRLMNGISQVKQLLRQMCVADPSERTEKAKQCDKIVKHVTKVKVAGQTTEFVNRILEKVKAGTPNGGLDEFQS